MTFTEWLNAVCAKTRFAGLSEVERLLLLPVSPATLTQAWKDGKEPTEFQSQIMNQEVERETLQSGETFAIYAIALIESTSIRAWANSERNFHIIVKMAERCMANGKDSQYLATYLTCLAMGL